jgi:prevent-host-death family protein
MPPRQEPAMQVTATEAKNRFGYLCAQAKTAPVIVEKDGRPDSVIVSYAEYQSLKSAASKKTVALRRKEFNEKYKDWFAEQNRLFEESGLWCDGLVTWQQDPQA